MPNLQNAKKALRQSEKRASRNLLIKEELHSLRRYFRKAVTSGDSEKAQEFATTLTKKFDKAAQKSVLKKNTAARLKSRMMKKVNSMAK
ncbi:MAG: 30S ribosomal protein S20 [bacterium]|nr:30S ribosomal protein S20 [bacterium]